MIVVRLEPTARGLFVLAEEEGTRGWYEVRDVVQLADRTEVFCRPLTWRVVTGPRKVDMDD